MSGPFCRVKGHRQPSAMPASATYRSTTMPASAMPTSSPPSCGAPRNIEPALELPAIPPVNHSALGAAQTGRTLDSHALTETALVVAYAV